MVQTVPNIMLKQSGAHTNSHNFTNIPVTQTALFYVLTMKALIKNKLQNK